MYHLHFLQMGICFLDASIDLQEIKESISLDDFPSPDELKKDMKNILI